MSWMVAAGDDTLRIWYQGFTDPEVDAPYFSRLTSHVSGITGPGFDVVAHGTRPGDRYLHRELRCSVRAVHNAITAGVRRRRGPQITHRASARRLGLDPPIR